MNPEYKHTQIGLVTIIMILLVGALTWFAFDTAIKSADGQSGMMLKLVGLLVAGLFVLMLAAFYSFTIQMDGEEISFWFGFGVAGKKVSFKDIRSFVVVQNPWYYFWGIKSIPGGWLYSIAPGGRAVELVLKDGKLIRLGTNHPEEIEQRLEKSMVFRA